MKVDKYKIRITALILLTAVLLIITCMIFIRLFNTGEEATVGIFSLAATVLGTVFIAVELKNGSDVTCSEMLIEQNNYFHESDRLMKVYQILEDSEAKMTSDAKMWEDVTSAEIAQYCTFFENLYLLYKHHIVSIDDLDDLFGYRFFLFMNNPYIQEHYILPTSSSYVQIFELYRAWIKRRKHIVPFANYVFPDCFLRNRLYSLVPPAPGTEICTLESKTAEYVMRTLGAANVSEIMAVQQKAVSSLPDKKIYYPLTRAEILESVYLDKVAGIFTEDGELVAFCVVVNNRKGNRNLAGDLSAHWADVLTFDAVVVDEHFRGNGFHQAFLDWSIGKAKESGVDCICATVDPSNIHSRDNFLAKGFRVVRTIQKYDDLSRDLLVLNRLP